jgi:hypothetical protein
LRGAECARAVADAGIDIGNIAADLACQYGDGWFTRNDIFWAVIGVDYGGSLEQALRDLMTWVEDGTALARQVASGSRTMSS